MIHSLYEFRIRIPVSGLCQDEIDCGRVFFDFKLPDPGLAMGFKQL